MAAFGEAKLILDRSVAYMAVLLSGFLKMWGGGGRLKTVWGIGCSDFLLFSHFSRYQPIGGCIWMDPRSMKKTKK
jgi:hypothetical protein